jgi:hypothetical protein
MEAAKREAVIRAFVLDCGLRHYLNPDVRQCNSAG